MILKLGCISVDFESEDIDAIKSDLQSLRQDRQDLLFIDANRLVPIQEELARLADRLDAVPRVRFTIGPIKEQE